MKFTVAIFAAAAAVANAQSQCEPAAEGIPACALGYIASAASASFQCGLVDFQCQCSNSNALQGALAPVLATVSNCNLGDVIGAVGSVCACARSNSGMTLTATPASCESAAAAIPPCALGYLASAGKAIGGCSVQDFACQCSNSASIAGAIANDLNSACGGGGLNAVLSSAGALCSCAAGAGGAGPTGGSSAAPTTGGSGSASPSATTGGSASSAPKATSSAKASGSSPGFSTFTGGAATASVGGVLAFIGGLVAML